MKLNKKKIKYWADSSNTEEHNRGESNYTKISKIKKL